jgi:hypothetical protein
MVVGLRMVVHRCSLQVVFSHEIMYEAKGEDGDRGDEEEVDATLLEPIEEEGGVVRRRLREEAEGP